MSGITNHVIMSGELPELLANPQAAVHIHKRFGGYTLRVGTDELALFSKNGKVYVRGPGNTPIDTPALTNHRIEVAFVRTDLCHYEDQIEIQRPIYLPNATQPYQQATPLKVDISIRYRIRAELARERNMSRLSFSAVFGVLSLFKETVARAVERVFREKYLYSIRFDHVYLADAIARELQMETTLDGSEMLLGQPIPILDIHHVAIRRVSNLPLWPDEQLQDEFIMYSGVLESAPCFGSGMQGAPYFRVPPGAIAVLGLTPEQQRRERSHYPDDGAAYPVGQAGTVFAPEHKYLFMLLLRSDRLSRTEPITVNRAFFVPNTNPPEHVELPVNIELETSYEVNLGSTDLQRVTSEAFRADLKNLRTILEQVALDACNCMFLSELKLDRERFSRVLTDRLNEHRMADLKNRQQRNGQSAQFLQISQVRVRRVSVPDAPRSHVPVTRPLVYFGALDSAPQAQYSATAREMQLILSTGHVAVIDDGSDEPRIISERKTRLGKPHFDSPGLPIVIASIDPVSFPLECSFSCYLPDPLTGRRSDQRFENRLVLNITYSLSGLRDRRDRDGIYTADRLLGMPDDLKNDIAAIAQQVVTVETHEMWRALLLPDRGYIREELMNALAYAMEGRGVEVAVKVHDVPLDPAFTQLLERRWQLQVQEAQFALDDHAAHAKARLATLVTPQQSLWLALQDAENIRQLIGTATQQLAEAYASRDPNSIMAAEDFARRLLSPILGPDVDLPPTAPFTMNPVSPAPTPAAAGPLFGSAPTGARVLPADEQSGYNSPFITPPSVGTIPGSASPPMSAPRSFAAEIEECRQNGVTITQGRQNRYALSFPLLDGRPVTLLLKIWPDAYDSRSPEVQHLEIAGGDFLYDDDLTLPSLERWMQDGTLMKVVHDVRQQLMA